MQQVIIAIHLMVVVALVILVLYQKSEGGALGMGGGQGNFFTGRGQANALTRATSILGTIFFLTSIALTLIPAWERRAAGGEDWTKAIDPADIQFRELKPGEKAPPASDPAKETIFDQLQRKQIERQQKQSAPVEAPKVEAPRAADPPKADASRTEAPRTEAPKTEPPKAEAPKAEAPAADAPKPADAPALRPTQEPAPAAEAPKPAEPLKWGAPKTDAAPAGAATPAEAPKAEAPKAESPKAEPPKADAPVQWKSPGQ